MKFTRDEEAVSPVIGVILMVAITVILAAVIAVFVFGLAGNIQSTKTVAITATKYSGGGFNLTCHGGADIGTLDSANVTIDGVEDTNSPWENIATGSTFNTASSASSGRLMVIGNFTDGSTQILLDKTF